jgi:hypothetical protein
MDFSCNNLSLEPGYVGIKQMFPITMTTLDIIRQLQQSPWETSPCRDIKWTTNKTGEGRSGKYYLEDTGPGAGLPNQRINKFRNTKKFKFVEYAEIPGHPLTLFHGTDPNAATSIVSSQHFRPSTSGNLGPGVYMSRDWRIIRMFATGAVLQGEYMISTVFVETVNKQFPGDGWQAPANAPKSFMLPSDWSPRAPTQAEEICIRDETTIKNIRRIF